MDVDLEDKRFCLTGKLTTMTHKAARAAIEKAGGTLSRTVSFSTDYMIVGSAPDKKLTEAKALGITLLKEHQFKALLAGKSPHLREIGAAGTRSVDDLLGDARSVMSGELDARMWSRLIALLDTCRMEDVAVLAEYINGYLTRWTRDTSDKDTVIIDCPNDQEGHARRVHLARHRSHGKARCAAPAHWLGQLVQGADSPKYKIVRALDLFRHDMDASSVATIVGHPGLTRLEELRLPEHKSPTRVLVEAIAAHDTLHTLYLGAISRRSIGNFTKIACAPPRLTTLDLNNLCIAGTKLSREEMAAIFASTMFECVSCLSMPHLANIHWELLLDMQHERLLPSCRTLRLARITPRELTRLLEEQLFERDFFSLVIDDLRVDIAPDKLWVELLAHEPRVPLGVLDLSHMWPYPKRTSNEDFELLLRNTLPDSRLLDHVDTLALGQHKTSALTEALSTSHPNLTVV